MPNETTFNLHPETGFLGEGGAGRVYEVTDEEGRTFAPKILHSASTLQRKTIQERDRIVRKNPLFT